MGLSIRKEDTNSRIHFSQGEGGELLVCHPYYCTLNSISYVGSIPHHFLPELKCKNVIFKTNVVYLHPRLTIEEVLTELYG